MVFKDVCRVHFFSHQHVVVVTGNDTAVARQPVKGLGVAEKEGCATSSRKGIELRHRTAGDVGRTAIDGYTVALGI